jgi:hypothetical protein
MRSSFFCRLAVLTIFASALAAAQNNQAPSSSAVPAQAKKGAESQPALPKAEPKHDYSQEAFVAEQDRTIYRFEADGTGRKENIARIRVQSEAGVQQWGQLQFGYNSANERVEIGYVRVVKSDGSIVKAGDDAVQDLSMPVEREAPVYTDYRQKHVTVPGLRPGEVLEFDIVTVIHTPLAPNQFWMDYDFDKTNITLDEERLRRRRKPTAGVSIAGRVLIFSGKTTRKIRPKRKSPSRSIPMCSSPPSSVGSRSAAGMPRSTKTAAPHRPKFAPRQRS